MTMPYRHNFKWNVNELLSLQREYELLEMTIQDIAIKHERSIDAILFRLQKEGFIETWIDARGYQEYSKTLPYLAGSLDSGINAYDYDEDVTDDDLANDKDSDYEEENEISEDDENYEHEDEHEDEYDIYNVNQRIWGLENAIKDIKGVINKLLSRISPLSPSNLSLEI
jgi:hypothetical protein